MKKQRLVKILPLEKWKENGWKITEKGINHKKDGGYANDDINEIEDKIITIESVIGGYMIYKGYLFIKNSIIEKELTPDDYPEFFI